MKIFFLVVTSTTLLFFSLCILMLAHNVIPILIMFLCSLLLGLYLYLTKPTMKETGWGILFGSLFFIAVALCYVIWLGLHSV
jgi:hypothetical protein